MAKNKLKGWIDQKWLDNFSLHLRENSTTPGIERAPRKLIASSSPPLLTYTKDILETWLVSNELKHLPVLQYYRFGWVRLLCHPLHHQEGDWSRNSQLAYPSTINDEQTHDERFESTFFLPLPETQGLVALGPSPEREESLLQLL